MGAMLSQTSDRKTRRSSSLSVEVQDWLNSTSFIPPEEIRQLSFLCENLGNDKVGDANSVDATHNCAPNIFRRKRKSSDANRKQSVCNDSTADNNDLPKNINATKEQPLQEVFLKHHDSDISLALAITDKENITDEDIITYLACRAILDSAI
ncbi:uncharacterized protein LOC143922674 [Arctopsyche grandis]|uniref:uncharacterized protein LOC143922674 n=1 Tax=Arctopsyche grandis TaxID=121162 RepID=UPI00406D6725